jgi:hypothetical protein
MELSNPGAKFRNHLLGLQIHWSTEPTLAGPAIIDLEMSGYHARSGVIDVTRSCHAVLEHDSKWKRWQLLAFPLDLKLKSPKGEVDWFAEGAALNGYINDRGRRHRLWQLYPNSGGQLKYYPLLEWAKWVSDEFELEVAPIASPLDKPKNYWPSLWPA